MRSYVQGAHNGEYRVWDCSVATELLQVFKEIPFGIEHTLKVLKNAEDIMNGENIGEEEKEFISIIAILHDIGVVEAQKNTVLLMVSIKKRKDQQQRKKY